MWGFGKRPKCVGNTHISNYMLEGGSTVTAIVSWNMTPNWKHISDCLHVQFNVSLIFDREEDHMYDIITALKAHPCSSFWPLGIPRSSEGRTVCPDESEPPQRRAGGPSAAPTLHSDDPGGASTDWIWWRQTFSFWRKHKETCCNCLLCFWEIQLNEAEYQQKPIKIWSLGIVTEENAPSSWYYRCRAV